MALQEWGLTPEYINRRWTEELLALMFISRARRYERQLEAAASAANPNKAAPRPHRLVPEEVLFKQAGYEVEEVVKKCPSV